MSQNQKPNSDLAAASAENRQLKAVPAPEKQSSSDKAHKAEHNASEEGDFEEERDPNAEQEQQDVAKPPVTESTPPQPPEPAH